MGILSKLFGSGKGPGSRESKYSMAGVIASEIEDCISQHGKHFLENKNSTIVLTPAFGISCLSDYPRGKGRWLAAVRLHDLPEMADVCETFTVSPDLKLNPQLMQLLKEQIDSDGPVVVDQLASAVLREFYEQSAEFRKLPES